MILGSVAVPLDHAIWSVTSREYLAEIASVFETRMSSTCLALEGECGMGKTEFVRQLIHAIDSRRGVPARRVQSASFSVHQSYSGALDGFPPIEHFDFYRLSGSPDELEPIGFEAVRDRCLELGGIVCMEWASRFSPKLLGLTHRLRIEAPKGAGPESRTYHLERV